MASQKTKYNIYFYIQKSHKQILNNQLEIADCEFKEQFTFIDYDSQQKILDIKEYFLSFFGHKYPCCICQLILCKKQNRFTIIDNAGYIIDNINLNSIGNLNFYLIKKYDKCECELTEYKNYFLKNKYELIQEYKQYKDNFIKIFDEYGTLKETNNKEIKNLKSINFRISKANELDNLKDDDYYDIIIDIKSLKSIKEGWKIILNEEGKKRYEKYKNQKLLKIGAIGNSKKGKSFLLNKISNINLKIGASNQTIGLSVKYPELQNNTKRHIIILDSVGFEKPILKEANDLNKNENMEEEKEEEKEEEEKENEKKQKKVFKERANDRAMTEMFLTNFILKNSDILLLVVGEMTYSEQLLIDKIKEESKKLKLKKIFIVHNLQTLRKKEQVEQYIHNTLFKNINLNLIKTKLIDINEDSENDDNKKEKDIKNDKKDSIDINNINLQKKVVDMNNKINLKYTNLNNINLNNINLKENNFIKDVKKGDNIIEIEENKKEKDQNLNKNLKKNKDNKIDLNKIENNIINNKLDEEEDEKEEEKKKDEKEGKNDNNKDILKDYKDSDNDSDSNSNEISKLEFNNKIILNDKKKDNNENKKINNIIENKDYNILENKEKIIYKNYKEALHYCEVLRYDNGNIDIYHLILANEDSEAGQFYNKYTYSFIENRYNDITELKAFDVLEEVKNVFKDIAPLVLYKKIDINFDQNEDILNNGLIQLKSKEELPLKSLKIDESNIFNKNKKFQPKYNCYKPDDKTLEIRLEIPGNFECNVDKTVIGDKTKIIFKGNKKPDKSPKNPEDNFVNLREFNDFEANIDLPVEEFQISSPDPKEGYPKKINGIYIIQYELVSKGKEISLNADDV